MSRNSTWARLTLACAAIALACEQTPTDVPPVADAKTTVRQTAEGLALTSVLPGVVGERLLPGSDAAARLSASVSLASVTIGSDLGGADLTPADGDVLSGTFTNVGTFRVPAGATVYIDHGVPLSITANNVVIEGTLDGGGAGYTGGPSPSGFAAPGIDGGGPGSGQGGEYGVNIHGPGGGGGGYGGVGGQGGMTLGSPPAAPGGPSYGSPSPPGVQLGSGGGSAANHNDGPPGGSGSIGGPGGAGGGAISLVAGTITVDGGVIIVPGENGESGQDGNVPGILESGGGGGSGGGIWLDGVLTLVGSTLNADGGSGGDILGSFGYATGGGGGAGGRIKLSGCFNPVSAFVASAQGGSAGSSLGSQIVTLAPSPGSDGSVVDATSGPCEPAQITEVLAAEIQALVSGGQLTAGLGTALTAKLNQIEALTLRGKESVALGVANAFINHVNSLVEDGELDPATGAALVQQAQILVGLLGG